MTIALVLVLAALTVRFLEASSRKSKLSRCTSNLREVSKAVIALCNENGQVLPTPAPGEQKDYWWWYKEAVIRFVPLSPAGSTNTALFACPNDRGYSNPRPFYRDPRFDYGSYVYNAVHLQGAPNIAGRSLSSIRMPEKTLLVMEWTAHAPLSWHESRTGKRNFPFYSDARSVVGFVDGRVKLVPIYFDGYNAAFTRNPIGGYEYKYSGD